MGRRRGTSTFPVARIKKIMQADEDVGKIATATPVLVAKALECLMEDLLRDAATVALTRRTKTVTPQHLKHSVSAESHFDFLRPTLANIPSLDDANAVQPARRSKRPRTTPSPTPPVITARRRALAPSHFRDGPAQEPRMVVSTGLQDSKRARLLPPPASSPVAVAAGANQNSPSLVSPVPIPLMRMDDDDDDYDGDECSTTNPPSAAIAALCINTAAPPVIIRDFGLPPQARKAAAAEQRPSVTTSERVSVHALLS